LDFFRTIRSNIKEGGRFSRFDLDLKNEKLIKQEFRDFKYKILYNESHKVVPSENVKYVRDQSIPICVIGL